MAGVSTKLRIMVPSAVEGGRCHRRRDCGELFCIGKVLFYRKNGGEKEIIFFIIPFCMSEVTPYNFFKNLFIFGCIGSLLLHAVFL